MTSLAAVGLLVLGIAAMFVRPFSMPLWVDRIGVFAALAASVDGGDRLVAGLWCWPRR
ncbi:MAG TPA: hypothetical protein VIK05_12730 [Ilumatobacteraceae bacterium]